MPVYTYTNTQPGANTLLSQSQPLLLNNTLAIEELVKVNHVGFNVADFGKHTFIQFQVQSVTPPFSGVENGLYSKVPTSPTTGVREMFVRKSNGSTIPFTASVLSYSSPTVNTDGWTYLPSGLIIKWGVGAGNGTVPIVFPVAANIPVFNIALSAMVTARATPTAICFQGLTPTGMNVITTANIGFNYVVIGY